MNDELRDPDLESLLGRASGAFPDVNVAYESVRGRVRQAKRRRVMVVSSTACALLIAGGVLAVQAAGGTDGTSVADTPTIVVETSKITEATDDDVTESTEPTESTEADESTEPTESSAPETSEPATTQATSPSSSGSQGSSSTSATSSSNSGHGSTSSSATSTTDHDTKPTLPSGDTVKCVGGWVRYTFENGQLVLADFGAAPGWHVKADSVEKEKDRIRVEFSQDGQHDTGWRIEIRAEGGKQPVETAERG